MKRERVMRWEEKESEALKFFPREAKALASRGPRSWSPWALDSTVKNNVPESGHGN